MPNTNKKYNLQIDIYRLIFAIIIFIYHSHKFLPEGQNLLFRKGYLAVEFFFIVSGYFFAESVEKNREESTVKFMYRKVKAIFPYYIMAFIIAFVLRQIILEATPGEIVKNMLMGMQEAGFLQMFGIKTQRIYNGVTWYISSMFIAMAVLHPIAKRCGEYYSAIGAFILSMAGYAVICQENHTLEIADKWFAGITYMGNIRAIAGISMGVACHSVVKAVNSLKLELTVWGRIFLTISQLLIWGLLMYILGETEKSALEYYFDYVSIGLFFMIIALSMIEFSQIRIRINHTKIVSMLSLLIYLNHRGSIYWIRSMGKLYSSTEKVCLYVVGTMCACVLCYFGGNILRKTRKWLQEMLFKKA